MRTTFLSLACLASSALAAPGGRWSDVVNKKLDEYKGTGDNFPQYHPEQPEHYPHPPQPSASTTCTEESQTTAPVQPASYGTSASTPAGPGSYSYSFTGNSSSFGPTATGTYNDVTTTLVTTIYETYCPGTKTHIESGSTSLSTYMTTSTITDVYTSTITAPSYSHSKSEDSPVGPGSYPQTTETEMTTVYTTICPATTIESHGETTLTKTYETTSTVTSVYTATVTLSNSPSESSPVGGGHGGQGYPQTTEKEMTTVYTTVCPATSTEKNGETTITKTYETTSTVTSIYTSTMTLEHPGSTSEGSGETTTTELTTTFTSLCPVTTTVTEGESVHTKTYETTSTITSVYTSTVVVSKPSGPGGYPIWTTIPWGTTMLSYTVPAYPTKSSSANVPHGPGSYPSQSIAPYPTNSESSEGGSAPSGSAPGYSWSSGSPIHTSSSGTGSPSDSHSIHPTGGSSSSGSVGPYPTGSHSHSGYPTGSGSWSILPTGPSSGWLPTTSLLPTGTGPHSIIPTGASTYPAGNSTSSVPGSTGTISHTTSSSTSSSCTKPTPSLIDLCIPCEGQPGNDPEKFCGYTLNDNSYNVMPKTCRTREYFFEMTNQTVSPDGIPRVGLVINGQLPGPKIEANWGDTIVVHVLNSLQNNGSSIHFHGMRQNYTNEMDGVPSITQCAIAPGDSMTYTFKATNYGTSWYHSHFAIQTYEGIFGPMVIHGPAAEEYDEEEMIVIQDWSHATADSMYQAAQTVGNAPDHGPRTLDTGLINGMNIWGTDGAANATGQRFRMSVVQGKTYRLRLVNTAIQSTFKFYIDGHKFKVIANDFVPIVPYETNIVNINIGQRYDLIFKADQPIGNYWMRADNQNICAAITYATNIKGIVSYVGASYGGVPTSTAYNYTAECVDEPYEKLVPIVPMNAGPQDDQIEKTVVVGANGASPNLYKWTLSGTSFQSQWGDPTLTNIVNNGSIPTYSGDLAIEVPKLKEWVYVIIDSPIPLPHPIHLHGHDFLVLAQGKGLYNSAVELNTVNPPRRDVATMPWDPVGGTGGHLVIAFETDNPGVWLMHCHIGWHTSMGFALQIIEAKDEIKKTVKNSCQLDDTCSKWHTYANDFDIHTDDSGV